MIALILILVFNSHYLKNRYFEQTSFLKNNIYFKLYKSGFEVFKDNKLFGVGNKNYRIETCNETKKITNISVLRTHIKFTLNSYLNMV